jgi:hypothetical protein
MSLPMIVDTLHAVPEAQRVFYVEQKGKFYLDVEGQEDWPKEKAALKAELQATRASERGSIMERLAVALKNGGATPAGCDLFHYHLDKRIRIETVEGKRIVRILQADGLTRTVGSGKDGLATFDDLVKEAATQYPFLFQTNGAPADTSPNGQRPNTGTRVISRKDFDALDPVERHRKIVKEGYRVFDEVIERRPKPAGTSGSKTMSRKDFDALHPFEKAAKIKAGFTLFDEN